MQDLERTDTAFYIGIDVCKSRLDVHIEPSGERFDVANTTQGIRQLVNGLIKLRPELVVFEATGKYHRRLHTALEQAGVASAVINPRRLRSFAEAAGQLAKSDTVDAHMLALYARVMRPERSLPNSQLIEELKELVAARRTAVDSRTQLSNQIGETSTRQLLHLLNKRLDQINREISMITKWILQLIKANRDLNERYKIILSIPGMGKVNAITCLAEMPELGQCNDKKVAALAGLAPFVRRSGKWAGKSSIKGGRASVRNSLYMAALTAIRYNPAMSNFYNRLIDAGKPFKIAITAVMRKLIILANTLINQNRSWLPVAP